MTRIREKEHPWRSMSDVELLRSAGLILKDEHTQKEGVTIAAILLFGAGSTIMSVLPQHKTDARSFVSISAETRVYAATRSFFCSFGFAGSSFTFFFSPPANIHHSP